jgi:alpha-1,2-mannosyltransferase
MGTPRWVPLAILVVTTAAWAAAFCLVQLVRLRSGQPGYIDALVYRAGGHALLTGNPIYAPDFGAVNHSPGGLPFTYPPFAALLFVPLAIVRAGTAIALMVVLNAAACAGLFGILLAAAHNRWDRPRGLRWLTAPISARTATVVLAAAIIFVLSTPVQGNFTYGQLDLILAVAVALDVLTPSVPWPRGLLVGLAAAIKLTPAVFIGYFLVTRQWRPLAASLGAAATAVVAGWLAAPSDTVRYFSETVFDSARIGQLRFASNQSLRGVIERIPAFDPWRGAAVVGATLAVLSLAVVAIEVSRRSGDVVAAMLSAAFIGLLCSPVSWSHHWLWLSATAVYLLMRWAANGGAGNLVAGLAVAVVVLVPPWLFLPHGDGRERLWNGFEHLMGSAWALSALALLAWFASPRRAYPVPAPELRCRAG